MNFEGWLESKGYMEGYEHDYQDAYDEGFDEGQQSQQGEVDRLQTEIDELQARVDKALKELELLTCYRTGNSDNAIDILKGERSE